MIERLDRDWCLEPLKHTPKNKFNYTNTGDQYAVDQILITGHYLYSLNQEFRRLYKETFESEMTLVGKDQPDFLYMNNFNLIYFGLLAAPYLIAQGDTPKMYLERCSAEGSGDLSRFVSEESLRVHHPVSAKPGMPFYYYRIKKTKFFKNSLTGNIEFICPARAMLSRAIEYAQLLQEDAQITLNELLETDSIRAAELMDVIRDETWSPFLYGKR